MSTHTFPKINQKEYLKKYLSGDKVKKKKKDKKHKKSSAAAVKVKIIDDDINHLDNGVEIDEELLLTGDDAPQIVGEYIEEIPSDSKLPKWKSIVIKDEPENDEDAGIQNKSDLWGIKSGDVRIKDKKRLNRSSPPGRRERKRKSASLSPPRKLRNSTSPPRQSKRDRSPTRNRKNEEYNKIKTEPLSPPYSKRDYSPTHIQRDRNYSQDNSPPRRKRNSDQSPSRKVDESSYHRNYIKHSPNRRNSDQSPPRKGKSSARNERKRSPYQSPHRRRRNSDQSPPRIGKSPSRNVNRRSPEQSPPRYRKNYNQSPPRRGKSPDQLPSRRKRVSVQSPSRKSRLSPQHRRQNWDQFSPRNRRNSPDNSPERRKHSTDQSPPQMSKNLSHTTRRQTLDQSPPRKGQRSTNQSPPRRRRNFDQSPPRKNRNSPDLSPLRKRRNSDQSPPRKSRNSPSTSRKRSPDQSPPRRRRETPLGIKREKMSPAQSPPQRRSRWERQDREKSFSPPPTHKPKPVKTLEGKKAGLQDAHALQKETVERRKQEDLLFERMSSDISGRNAEVQVRSTGRKGRRAREAGEEDPAERRRKEEHEEKKKLLYERWGKGLKQIEDHKQRMLEQQHEGNKPLARYSNDEDLERHLKEQERAEDPMLEYMRKKRKEKEKQSGKPQIPRYEGPFPENRFGIRPGYRWDGVDRSNGYEKKWFAAQNEKRARQDEAYKYSVEDM